MLIPLILYLLFTVVHAWGSGYYQVGIDCFPCHSSCKNCSAANSCDSWENYMVLDTVSKLWKFWLDGEYYDFSSKLWRSWAGSCNGYWSYQKSWFKWNPGEKLDLDTLGCSLTCNSSQILINDTSSFNIAEFWRSLDYFIDPSSTKILELGTQMYPFRSLYPAFFEIMKFHSHTQREVTVFIKEGTENTVEDSTIYVINLKLVTINTYSDLLIPGGVATIITTDVPQVEINPKAAFHIIKNSSIDLNLIISQGSFSTTELLVIGKSGAAFEVIRTSITINNIICRRKASSTKTGVFLYLIYLQYRTMTLSKFSQP